MNNGEERETPLGDILVGGKSLIDWDMEWALVAGGFSILHPDLRYKVGLFRAILFDRVMFIGQATEWNGQGLTKRLSDFRRKSNSGSCHSAGYKIRENLTTLTLEILVTGSGKSDADIAKKLKPLMNKLHKPDWDRSQFSPPKGPK